MEYLVYATVQYSKSTEQQRITKWL